MSESAIIAIGCGLVAATAWGIGDFWAAKVARLVGPVAGVLAANTLGLMGFILYYLLAGNNLNIGGDGLGYAAAAGVSIGIGNVSFFQALKAGELGESFKQRVSTDNHTGYCGCISGGNLCQTAWGCWIGAHRCVDGK